jgi:cytochrome c-type biogenesis protein CcmH/NrfF
MLKLSHLGRGVIIVIVAVLTMGAADTSIRFNDLGHKMMCVCGCNQILIECNHVGCPDSDRMLGELRAGLAGGAGDKSILASFQEKYGPTVLAAPMLTRFNIVAWVVPPGLLLIGIGGTVALVRRWRLRAAGLPVVARSSQFQTMRDKIRRETEL